MRSLACFYPIGSDLLCAGSGVPARCAPRLAGQKLESGWRLAVRSDALLWFRLIHVIYAPSKARDRVPSVGNDNANYVPGLETMGGVVDITIVQHMLTGMDASCMHRSCGTSLDGSVMCVCARVTRARVKTGKLDQPSSIWVTHHIGPGAATPPMLRVDFNVRGRSSDRQVIRGHEHDGGSGRQTPMHTPLSRWRPPPLADICPRSDRA